MPAKRRRTLSRSPIERLKMWDAKMKGDIYATQLSATKPLALPKVASYMVTHEYLISIVKNISAQLGIEGAKIQEYMWYAQKMEKLARTYGGEALQKEADSLYLWYLSKGMNDIMLRSIAQALGIKISAIETIMERTLAPLLLKVISEGSITTDGTEQTILEYYGLTFISGYIDLSSMDDGDEIRIKAYVKIQKDGDWILYRSEPIADKQAEPALYVLPRLSGYAFKIIIQQTAGSYKTFKYLFVKCI